MNEHKNIITIEDEIKEFSDKPVKSSALYKKVKELESNAVPDASEASVGDVLTKGEDGIGWVAPSGGSGGVLILTPPSHEITSVEGHSVIRLCTMGDVMSAMDVNTRARTKAIFINVPAVSSFDQSSWSAIQGFYAFPNNIVQDAVAEYGSTTVNLAVGNDGDFYLKYSSR